jgi:hypothetical protein
MIGATDDRLADEEKCQSAVGLSTRSLPHGGLIGAFPRPDFLDSHSQHPPSATPGSAPWRTRAFDQVVWPGGDKC